MKEKSDISSYWSLRLFRTFCPEHLYEEIEGDLIQKFNKEANLIGERKAKRRLLWTVLRFFRPGIVLRNKFSLNLNHFDMIGDFLTIFWRSSFKNASYSFINIFGLAVGITACMLIGF